MQAAFSDKQLLQEGKEGCRVIEVGKKCFLAPARRPPWTQGLGCLLVPWTDLGMRTQAAGANLEEGWKHQWRPEAGKRENWLKKVGSKSVVPLGNSQSQTAEVLTPHFPQSLLEDYTLRSYFPWLLEPMTEFGKAISREAFKQRNAASLQAITQWRLKVRE
jgi:hypothetical protein